MRRETKLFTAAVGFRIVIFLLGAVIMFMFGSYENGLTIQQFLDNWSRWDAGHYLGIAESGYRGMAENGMHLWLVFFPLYPWLVRFAALIVRNYALAGFLVSLTCYGIAVVYFDKWMCLEESEEVSRNTLLVWSLFPFAFFFGTLMTESLFVAITAAFFYYLRKHRWVPATVLGALGCMTKVQGVLFSLAIFVEILYSNRVFDLIRERRWRQIWSDVVLTGLKCVPMFLGIAVYLYINYRVEGNPLTFLEYERNHWNQYMISMWETIKYIWFYLSDRWYQSEGVCIWLPEFVLFFVYIIAILYAFVKKMRPTYIVWLIAWFCVMYSCSWLLSGGRYTLAALPLFALGGKFVSEHPKVRFPVLALSGACMMIYYVGYLSGKQIM